MADEGLRNRGLEEIEYAAAACAWLITLGFSRPWNNGVNAMTAVTACDPPPLRSYRVLAVRDADGSVLSVKRRDPME